MHVDLIIKDGTIYSETGWIEGDLLVNKGKICGIIKNSQAGASEVIDGRGKYVLPGLIDAHIHLRDPGYTHKEDYATGTAAAAAGGVTTVCDQPNTDPVPNTAEKYRQHIANAASKSYVDFNSMASPSRLEEIQQIASLGACGFKIFQKKTVYPYDTEASIPESDRILAAFREVAKTGRPCSVHPHNHDIYTSQMAAAKREGLLDARRFGELTTNALVYCTAVPELLYFQKKSGVYYYALHCNFSDYIEMVRQAKQRGAKIIADCIYFVLIPPAMDSPHKFDILKNHLSAGLTGEDLEACWKGVLDGTIDFITTDHAPHTVEEVTKGLTDPEAMALGFPGVEHFFSILLTAVNQGKIPFKQLVELLTVNPAKAFGFYPEKGSLQVGTDADIVIVDLEHRAVITGDNLYTKCGWTPYEGEQVQGVPTHTILRGQVICRNGQVTGKSGYGKFVPAGKVQEINPCSNC